MVSSRQLPNLQATMANFHSECDQMSQVSVISITRLLSMCLSPMTSSYGATDTCPCNIRHKANSQRRGRDRRLLQGKLRTGTCFSLACCIPTVNRRPYSEVEKSGLLAEHLQPPASAFPWHTDVSAALNYLILHLPGVDSQMGHAEIEISISFSFLCQSFLLMHESMSTRLLVAIMWV